MSFRTEIFPSDFDCKINYHSKLMALGSCFSQRIGKRLKELKFQCELNPFGTIFNPYSLFLLLEKVLKEESLDENLLLEVENLVFHYQLHSDHYAKGKKQFMEQLSLQWKTLRKQLVATDVLLLTFGTAYVYQLKDEKAYVANCHKQPSALFEKKCLSVAEMKTAFDRFYSLIKAINPKVQLLITVSPVRHLRDGLENNTLSKSVLHLFRQELTESYDDISYFPSYEILMDDLRDYRFYEADMLHPNSLAIDYIWEKFTESCIETSCQKEVLQVKKLLQAVKHRPLHPESEAHQKFLQTTLVKVKQYHKKLDFSEEIKHLESQVKTV